MLNADQTQIIPTSFPAVGFEFTEPNNKDWGPRLGATYRLTDKTVLRAGWGIYYNPNQMNSFTFLTNNPPIAAEFTFSNSPTNPTLSFDQPFGTRGPRRATEHDHAEPAISRTRARTSGAPTSSTSSSPAPSSNSSTSRRAPRTSIAASSTTRRCRGLAASTHAVRTSCSARSAPSRTTSSPTTTRSRVVARRRMTKGFMLNAHYTWSKTRDMATHSNGGGAHRQQLRHLERLRPGQLGRAAPAGGQLRVGHAVLPRLRQLLPARHRSAAGRSRGVSTHPERHAAQRHHLDRPRQHRPAEPAPECS